MRRVLQVSPVGYYDRRGRPRSTKTARHDAVVVSIKAIHGEAKARHGCPRIHAGPFPRGEPCCVDSVARLMRREGIVAKTKRRFRVTTDPNHGCPVAEDMLDRHFVPEAPNRAGPADITHPATGKGWPYLAAVEDL